MSDGLLTLNVAWAKKYQEDITTLRAEVERLTKAAEVSDQEWCDRENEAIQLEADFVTAEARADKAEAERDAAIARAEKAEKVLGYLKQDCLASGFSERSNSFVLAGDLLTSLTEGETE